MQKALSEFAKKMPKSEPPESAEERDPAREAFDLFRSALDDGDDEAAFDAFKEAVRCCHDEMGGMGEEDESEPHKPAMVITLGKRGR